MKASSQIGIVLVIAIVILTLFIAPTPLNQYVTGTFIGSQSGINISADGIASISADNDPANERVNYLVDVQPDFIRGLEPVSNFQWEIPGWFYEGQAGGGTQTSGIIYYTPIFVSDSVTFDRVGANVTLAGTVAGTPAVRFCLYNWEDGVPSTLVEDFGVVVTNTTGEKILTIDTTLERDYYFLAMFTNDSSIEFTRPTSNVRPASSGLATNTTNAQRAVLTAPSAGDPLSNNCADPALTPDFMQPFSSAFVKMRQE